MGVILQRRLKQSVPMENAADEAMINVLIVADYLRRRFEQIHGEHGLTQSQYNILRILRGVHPHGHPRCEITSRMIERAPDATRLIDKLEQMELVERMRIPEDRRLSVARITQKGLDLLSAIQPELEAASKEMLQKVSVEECLALSRICEKLYADELSADEAR
jgi:DNA-binding MarR family transcriptional regulator